MTSPVSISAERLGALGIDPLALSIALARANAGQAAGAAEFSRLISHAADAARSREEYAEATALGRIAECFAMRAAEIVVAEVAK